MKKVYIKTYGCQMNVSDSDKMKGILLKEGYTLVESEKDADIILLNTCSVRELAEQKVWSKLGEYHNKEGRKILGLTGCMAQRYGDKIFEKAPYVNLVCGTYRFHKIGQLLEKVLEGKRIVDVEPNEEDLDKTVVTRRNNPVCAFVPISRGCNNRCSYCVVPYVRGPERNRPVAEIVDEVKNLGCKEVTLLGQNVNSYRDGENRFIDLLKELNRIEGLERIRFVTSHPKDAGTDLFMAMAELDKVCEALHLPIQSGSNRILERMNRGYTREGYIELVHKLRQIVPHVAISTDIIVGFPGETEEDFQDTYSLMEEIGFDSAFIFKYSPRPGTPAESFQDDVPIEVKRHRHQCLLKLQDDISLKKNMALIGNVLEVLIEGISKNNKNRLMGRTRTNKIVNTDYNNLDLIGRLVNVEIIDVGPHALRGRIIT